MSGSVDSRIVTMKFENTAFQSGAEATLGVLARLKNALSSSFSGKGLQEVQKSANGFNMGTMEGAITGVSKSWVAMATVAITAISRATNAAISSAGRLAKSLTIDPISQGFHEYETNLNSIQTVLANTGLKGQQGLNQVNAALNELNTYSDKTIYNFSQMARNVGTFTAAGVDLKTSTAAIKGIANLAAVSGSSADQASTAMYQLSQALASGRVTLMDWNSVVNAGMGGKVFQKSLTETARAHGVAVDDIIKKEGSFRNSLQKGWLTSDILTETLGKFTGDLNASQLKTMGYNKEQIKGILEMGKTAQDAATKVKTVSQLIGTLQEAVGSGWGRTFQLVFGDFNEAKGLFTGVNNVLSGMINNSAKTRNKILGDWKKLGGRDELLGSIRNSFEAFMAVIKPIGAAFREIFPAMTGKRLADITSNLQNFTAGLKISQTTANNLKRTFAGVFAVFDIIKQVIGGVIGVFFDLFGTIGEGSGGILNFTGGIGDFLVSLDKAIKKGDGLKNFFSGLTAVLKVPIRLVQNFAGFLSDMFSAFDNSGNATKSIDDITSKMHPLQALGQRIKSVFSSLSSVFSRIGDALAPIGTAIGEAFRKITDALAESFSGGDFSGILDTINTALFGGFLVLMRKFLKNGVSLNADIGGGLFGSIKNTFGELSGTLQAMQTNIKADTLLKIAGAIGLMTLSVVALSLIDSDKLTKALTAMAVGFGQLLGGMAILTQISGSAGFLKIPLMAGSMVLLAASIAILAGALKLMSTMSWEEIGKGLAGTAGALVVVSAAMKLMPKSLPVTAAGLVLVGIGLNFIASAMKIMASLSWEDIGQGLVATAGSLVIIGRAMKLMPKTLPVTGAGLVLVGIGLNVVASAMKIMASMSWEEIAQGLVATGGSLVLIGKAMDLMPKNLPLTGLGLILVANALVIMGGALKIMATMSWDEIGRGLGTMGAMLLLLAAGLNAMSEAVVGAAALLIAAGAMAILAPVMVTLGSLSWEAIAKGMVVLAGALTIIGVAGYLLAPVAPVFIAFGAALALVGAGLALAGAGALAFATAFGIIVGLGAAGVGVLTAMLKAIIDLIPSALTSFGQGLIAFAGVIAKGGPQFTAAFTTLITSMLNALIAAIPRIGALFLVLVRTGLAVLTNAVPAMANAGLRIITGVINAVANNVGGIVKAATKLVVNFINALGSAIPRVVNAGVQFVIKLINGMAAAIDNNSSEMGAAGGRLAMAIVQGMVKGIAGGIGAVVSAAKNLAHSALDAAKGALGIHSPSKEFEKIGIFVGQGFTKGMDTDHIKTALANMRDTLKAALTATHDDVKQAQDKLDRLLKAKKPDKKAVSQARSDLSRARTEYARTADASNTFNKRLAVEQKELVRLAGVYDKVTASLKDANDKLAEAQKVRDDFVKSITDQYSALPSIDPLSTTVSSIGALPDIDKKTKVASYTASVEKQAASINTFKASLDQLRNLGLNDAAYKELLDKGVSTQPFLNDLISKGQTGVDELNRVTDNLAAASKSFSTTTGTTLKSYEDSLRAETSANTTFLASLNQLRSMGLDDPTYKKLLAEGTSAQPFLDELIRSGTAGVENLDVLTAQLQSSAQALGDTAGQQLYQAGVDSAQKLVDGLAAQQAGVAKQMATINNLMQTAIKVDLHQVGLKTAQGLIKGLKDSESPIRKQMAALAKDMVSEVKKQLKIKSPSQVMVGIGQFVNQGLANGLEKYSPIVARSAGIMANNAVDTIQTAMSKVSDAMSAEIDPNPVIAPVIDLDQFRRDAAKINDVVSANAISANLSYGQAAAISADQQRAQEASAATPSETPATVIQFEQNNYSPAALSPVDIYRQTRNQLSMAKEALNA